MTRRICAKGGHADEKVEKIPGIEYAKCTKEKVKDSIAKAAMCKFKLDDERNRNYQKEIKKKNA